MSQTSVLRCSCGHFDIDHRSWSGPCADISCACAKFRNAEPTLVRLPQGMTVKQAEALLAEHAPQHDPYLVERVAQALCRETEAQDWDELTDSLREQFRRDARVAMDALKDAEAQR